jgi:glycosyltransferase involved in cell wall biosynthesis
MRILLTDSNRYNGSLGGMSLSIRTLGAELAKTHSVVYLVPWSPSVASAMQSDRTGDTVHIMPLPSPISPFRSIKGFLRWLLLVPVTVFRLFRFVRDEHIDLIHTTYHSEYFYLRIMRWFGGPRYLLTFHGSDIAYFDEIPTPHRIFCRFVVGGASKHTAVSRGLAEIAETRFPQLAPVIAIWNGIARSPLDTIVTENKRPIPYFGHDEYVVCVGSLTPTKGQDILIRSWATINQTHPNLKLLLIGTGSSLAHYQSLAHELRCSDSIAFLGGLANHDVLPIIAGALALVLPSRSEGLGYVLLEAGITGTAVVASRVGGIPEIVIPEITGLLVTPENEGELSSALLRLFDDTSLRQRLAHNLRAHVLTNFSAEAMAARYRLVYSSLVQCQA